jgi:hypothetical protein
MICNNRDIIMLEKIQDRLESLQKQAQDAANAISTTKNNIENMIANHNAILGAIEVTKEYLSIGSEAVDHIGYQNNVTAESEHPEVTVS